MNVYTLQVKTQRGEFSEISPAFMNSVLKFIASTGSELRETSWTRTSRMFEVEFANTKNVGKTVEEFAIGLKSQLEVRVA